MVRAMSIADYEEVYDLWMSIQGFGIRSMDDSKEGIRVFLKRNPTTSAVDVEDGRIAGAVLCGHDGRRGCLYHVCVSKNYRRQGIGKKMVAFCMEALRKEQISKVCLNAFVINQVGNSFWRKTGWNNRTDLNYYDFNLNEKNITVFNQ